ncbi:MAG: hypothetical protein QOK36_1251 [Gaiellales bacterium]|nr:hypothetical protein [Gaiellales bacterium]
MPDFPRIRRFAAVAALAGVVAVPAADAAQVTVTALDGSFAGSDGWTANSTCAPLCTVTNMIDAEVGASGPGSATVVYTTLGGLLGGLAAGTSTWTSPAFSWAGPTPSNATLSLARKAAIGGLLSVGGTVNSRLQLRDATAGTTTLLSSEAIPAADTSFVTRTLPVNPSLLQQGHSYRVLITTNLSAAALLSGIRVSYDDVVLTGTSETVASPGDAGGDKTAQPTATDPAAPVTGARGSTAQLRLASPRVLRFVPGRAVTLRVRATRAGQAVAGLVVTLRLGTETRRAVTGRNGYAAVRLTRRSQSALRVTFRAGSTTATTWVRAKLRTPAA